jgi:hypothetical protein
LNWINQRKKKDEKHGPEGLFLVHAIMRLCRANGWVAAKRSRDWAAVRHKRA